MSTQRWSTRSACVPASDHAQRRVGQGDRPVLLDDPDAGAHQAAVGAAAAAPGFDALALGMSRVASEDRLLDIELPVQKGKTDVLHRRLHQEALGKRIYEMIRRPP